MVTIEEFKNALSIMNQYLDEQKQMIHEAEQLYLSKHPVVQKGDYIQITKIHKKRVSQYLKPGIRLRVLCMWRNNDVIRCRCVTLDENRTVCISSKIYDWEIISK